MRLSTPTGRWVIAATVLGSGMAAIDATVVGIALPSIGRQFHAQFGALQWVVTGYTLTLSALLLVGGSLGDRRGRRKISVLVWCGSRWHRRRPRWHRTSQSSWSLGSCREWALRY